MPDLTLDDVIRACEGTSQEVNRCYAGPGGETLRIAWGPTTRNISYADLLLVLAREVKALQPPSTELYEHSVTVEKLAIKARDLSLRCNESITRIDCSLDNAATRLAALERCRTPGDDALKRVEERLERLEKRLAGWEKARAYKPEEDDPGLEFKDD